MCIYLGNNSDLNYRKQEHVFPASLGGKCRLSKGVVSDEANELFSPLELQLTRHSLIAFDRIMYGPGKRGSSSPSKMTKSRIHVGIQDDGCPVLCYIAMGVPYHIPQLHFHNKDVVISIPDDKGEYVDKIKAFLQSFNDLPIKRIYLVSDQVPIDDALVGIYDHKIFIATHTNADCQEEKLKRFKDVLDYLTISNIKQSEHRITQSFCFAENDSVARMYGKTAINVLTLLKGMDYIQHPNFDAVKHWVVSGDAESSICTIEMAHDYELSRMVPEMAHWCVCVPNGNELHAIVCFYNHVARRIRLGQLPDDRSIKLSEGFICDWKNEEEYSLFELVQKIARSKSQSIE